MTISTRLASIWSAMAARRASAIPGRCRRRFPRSVNDGDLVVASVLSGNRNFEGRVNQDVRANYLASPPLVVAYALAGSVYVNLETDPLGTGSDGKPVFLRDIWPSNAGNRGHGARSGDAENVRERYGDVFKGDAALAGHQGRCGPHLCVGRQVHLRAEPALLRRHEHDADAAARRRRRAHARPVRRLRSPPTTSARPARSRR